MVFNFIVIVLAVVGLVISLYIRHKKSKNEKLVCVIGDDCDKVIRSEYAKTFGVDNIILGILYYIFLIGVFLIDGFYGFLGISFYWNILLFVTGLAGLTSLYLVYIQIFVLKEWCEYCLVTALVNILVFLILLL